MNTYAAVVFDFYGTLTPGRSDDAQRTARRAQAVALGVDPVAYDHELTATVDERFRGAGGDIAGSLRWVTSRLGVDVAPAYLDRGAEQRLASERAFGQPRPDAVEVLRAISARGLRIGLVSDCSFELPGYFDELPIAPYVEAPVFSCRTGSRKPEAANYLACSASLGVEPAACVYVGDGGSNELAGARDVGMRPVLLDVADDEGAVVYGRHVSWDGERIATLAEVLDVL